MYNVCVCERPPPVAVPSTVCMVTTTSLAREPLCTDTVTDLETVLSVSVKEKAVTSNPIVTTAEEEKW